MAFSNTPPTQIKLPYRLEVAAKSTGNVSLSAPPSTIDGVSLQGQFLDGRNASFWFINSQTTSSENGVYMLSIDSGLSVTVSGNFSAGSYTLSGLTSGKLYCVVVTSDVISVGNGTNTITFKTHPDGTRAAIIAASVSGTLTFSGPTTGTASASITAWGAKLNRFDTVDGLDYWAIGNTIHVQAGTTNNGKWYQITALISNVPTFTLLSNPPASVTMGWVENAPGQITV